MSKEAQQRLIEKLLEVHETGYSRRSDQMWVWECNACAPPKTLSSREGCVEQTRRHWAEVICSELAASAAESGEATGDSAFKAQEFLAMLPENELYKSGKLKYPPRGQGDIADLMEAYAADLKKYNRWQAESLKALRDKFGVPSNCQALDAIDELLKRASLPSEGQPCKHVFSKQSGCCLRCDLPEFPESDPAPSPQTKQDHAAKNFADHLERNRKAVEKFPPYLTDAPSPQNRLTETCPICKRPLVQRLSWGRLVWVHVEDIQNNDCKSRGKPSPSPQEIGAAFSDLMGEGVSPQSPGAAHEKVWSLITAGNNAMALLVSIIKCGESYDLEAAAEVNKFRKIAAELLAERTAPREASHSDCHVAHCNADRREPIGTSGCICLGVYKRGMAAPRETGWISVESGKLPDEDEIVLVTVRCESDDHDGVSQTWEEVHEATIYKTDLQLIATLADGTEYEGAEILGWRKLPEPPSGAPPEQKGAV
jgi:hypothetical protein